MKQVDSSAHRARINGLAWMGATLATALLALPLLAIGVPDPAAMTEQPMFEALVRAHAPRALVTGFLTATDANWQAGASYRAGMAYPQFRGDGCGPCEDVQVAYPHMLGLCIVRGEVLTVRFDRSGRAESFTSVSAVDGC